MNRARLYACVLGFSGVVVPARYAVGAGPARLAPPAVQIAVARPGDASARVLALSFPINGDTVESAPAAETGCFRPTGARA